MKTQEPNIGDKLSRQEYNKLYYEKNKKRLLNKKEKTSDRKVHELYSEVRTFGKIPRPAAPSPQGVLIWCNLFVLLGLVFLMTLYLIKESAPFYLDAHEQPLLAYMKAAIIEGAAIVFSFSQGTRMVLRWVQRIILLFLCLFSLWTMSERILKLSIQDVSRAAILKKTVQDLEIEKVQKEALREEYFNRKWLKMTRHYEVEVDQVRGKLNSVRQELIALKPTSVVSINLITLVIFRVLLFASNLVCLHLLAESCLTTIGREHEED